MKKTFNQVRGEALHYLGVRTIYIDNTWRLIYIRNDVFHDTILATMDPAHPWSDDQLAWLLRDFLSQRIDPRVLESFTKLSQAISETERWTMEMHDYYGVLEYDFAGDEFKKMVYGSGRYIVPITAQATLELCDFFNTMASGEISSDIGSYTTFHRIKE